MEGVIKTDFSRNLHLVVMFWWRRRGKCRVRSTSTGRAVSRGVARCVARVCPDCRRATATGCCRRAAHTAP